MKILTTIFLFVICSHSSFARKVYVSNIGSNANSGSLSSPYQTIGKVNSIFSTLVPGDSILFRRGDTFLGSLIATAAGSTIAPIVISAYGTGPAPVISGLILLHSWYLISGHIWGCHPDSTVNPNCNVLTIGGVPKAVGRTNWMVYQSATGSGTTGSLTSSSLLGTNYVGAEIVSRKNAFVSDRAIITAQSGTTVNFTTSGIQPLYNTNAGLQNGSNGYGFFLQRFAASLDQDGEWYFKSSTNEMQLYTTTDPNTLSIKASYVDAVVALSNRQNIVVENLTIEGASTYGVQAVSNNNIKVKNCTLNNNTIGVYMWNSNDGYVSSCSVNYSASAGIFIAGNSNQVKRINVLNNQLWNTGQLIGMGVFNKEFVLRGIVAQADLTSTNNYVNIIGNKVLTSGNGAIQYQGSNVLIRRNVSDTFCNQLDDNGGIYTFINNQSVNTNFYTNRLIDSNFISNAIGAPQGAPPGHLDVVGLYDDDQTCNVIAKHNTIWNIPGPGIQLNTPLNMILRDNTVYNTDFAVFVNKKTYGTISGVEFKGNVYYQKKATQYVYYYTNVNLSSPPTTITQAVRGFAVTDSNWVSNLKFQGYGFYYSSTGSGYTFPSPVTFTQWKGTYGHSLHTILPATVVTATNTTLEINPAYGNKVVSFAGLSKVDAKGNVYNNSATVPAWSSLVLIDNGSAPTVNQYPNVSAGSDQTIQAPLDSVTLTGVTNDPDGSIVTNSWLFLDGPNIPVIAHADSAITVVNGLVLGKYHFQLVVTDNSGAKSSSTVTVTVTDAAPPVLVPPTVDPGLKRQILLPKDSVHLVATSPDADIVTKAWTKFSGPVGAVDIIESPGAYATTISGLTVEGIYLYQISVTDSDGLTSSGFVQVTVRNVPATEGVLIQGWIFIDH